MQTVSKINKKICSEVFDEKYSISHKNRIKKVLDLLEIQNEGRLLDLGCGDGEITSLFSKETNSKLYGIDLVEENIKKAKEKNIQAKQCDLSTDKIPFEDSFFDIVYAGEILEHIYDTDELISEINRILKLNGVAIITVPNIACWYNRIFLIFGFSPSWIDSGSRTFYGNPFGSICGHVKAFTKRSICQLISNHNFVIEKVVGAGIDPFNNRWINNNPLKRKLAQLAYLLELFFANFPSLSTNIIIRVRKTKIIG